MKKVVLCNGYFFLMKIEKLSENPMLFSTGKAMNRKKWISSIFALARDDQSRSTTLRSEGLIRKIFYLFAATAVLSGVWLMLSQTYKQTSNHLESDVLRIRWGISAVDDPTGALGAKSLKDMELLQQLRPVDELDIYENKVARWFQVRVYNPENIPLVAMIKKSSYVSMQIFEQRSTDPLTKDNFIKTYDSDRRYWSDVFSSHYIHFLGDSSAASSVTFWVRATAATRLIMPIDILRHDEAAPRVSINSLAYGFYYGAIIVMILYNAFLYFFISDKVYLIYVFYLGSFLLTQMSVDGVLPSLFHFYGLIWTGHFGIMWGLLTVIFLNCYARIFLNFQQSAPRLDWVTKSAIILFTTALLIAMATPYSVGLKFVYISNIVCSLVLLLIGIGSYLGGYRPARYFIIGNLVLISASLFMALRLLGLIEAPQFTAQSVDFMIKFGSIIEVVFFSFALADRVNLTLMNYAKSQRSLHEAEVAKLESEKMIAEEIAKKNQFMVVAQMTQTLAHDIRKPFSMMKIGLDRLSSIGDDPLEIKDVVAKILLHVGKAFEDVNRMIADIMEVSSGPSRLHKESHSIRNLTQAAIQETFKYQEFVAINFKVEMQHRYMCQIDESKILRVIINILDNARQAMRGKGLIIITTRDVWQEASQHVEVSIHNSDSYINHVDLDRIFEPFFTKGKKGGTGLGLAISRKIIQAHDGVIYCKSSQGYGTEFVFTLPANSEIDSAEIRWPEDSIVVRREFAKTLVAKRTSLGDELLQRRTQQGLKQMVQMGRPFRVLVIDDESIYIEGIKNLVSGHGDIRFEFTCVDNPESAFDVLEKSYFDLIICDIDFPDSETDGFDFVVKLRENDPDVKICVHSNRVLPTDYRNAVQAGADSFLPKPMTYPHLIGLVVGDRFTEASA